MDGQPGAQDPTRRRPGQRASHNLEGARGSYESYLIVITSAAALSDVNLSASDLSDGARHTIPAANLTFFREAFVDFTGISESEPGNLPVPKNTPSGDGRIPDPLIPFLDTYTLGRAVGAPFNVLPGFNQPVWLDV